MVTLPHHTLRKFAVERIPVPLQYPTPGLGDGSFITSSRFHGGIFAAITNTQTGVANHTSREAVAVEL